jgi:hypothetical protein
VETERRLPGARNNLVRYQKLNLVAAILEIKPINLLTSHFNCRFNIHEQRTIALRTVALTAQGELVEWSRESSMRGSRLERGTRLLERGHQAEGVLARWAERVSGKQPTEVDDFERVAQVCDVALKADRAFFMVVEIDTDRSILREVRIDAAELEVEVIHHYLTVFRGILLRS